VSRDTTPARPPLAEAIRDRGFNPRRGDLPALLELLAGEEELAELAERALARLGSAAGAEAAARLPDAGPPLRARLCRLAGRVAQEQGDAALDAFLRERLTDPDAKTRRNAIIALGKLRSPGLEALLLEAWDREESLPHRRSLAAALGKVGGTAALDRLRLAGALDDAELRRLVDEAVLKIERTLLRDEPSRVDPTRAPTRPLPVRFRCRAGLEELLAAELVELAPELAPRVAGRGRVEATLVGPLARLQRPRLALRFGFPLPAEPIREGEELAEVVARVLTSAASLGVLRLFTAGALRFRLEWESSGHRRGATWRAAAAVSRRCAELINDPTASPWEAVIGEATGRRGHRLLVELWPRGLEDPRFAYRRRDVPAASHPTVAAALARLAGVREDDVVWDPFVGSGLELIERGLLGEYRRLYGSDLEDEALRAAGENLRASGLKRWGLSPGDARDYSPPQRPTLILTNPPMGRRVLGKDELEPLYAALLQRAAALLVPGGRLVWISPLPARTLELAGRVGLAARERRPIDMGGFSAEIQVLALARVTAGGDR